jgi:hypothetical protein
MSLQRKAQIRFGNGTGNNLQGSSAPIVSGAFQRLIPRFGLTTRQCGSMAEFGSSPMSNATNYLANDKLRREPEVLDADMTKSDLVDTLRRLKFNDEYCQLWIDRPVRDFLVSVMTATMRRK